MENSALPTTQRMKPLLLNFNIQRVGTDDDRAVEGHAFVNEVVEGEGGIALTRKAMEEASADYMQWGVLREMHQPIAAGTVSELTWDDKGAFIRCIVVDDAAWNKVKQRVYKGFSVGVQGLVMRGKQVTKCKWLEVSLVDRPRDEDAKIMTFRSDTLQPDYEVQVMDAVIELKPPAEPMWIKRLDTGTVHNVMLQDATGNVVVDNGESGAANIASGSYEVVERTVTSTNMPSKKYMDMQVRPADGDKLVSTDPDNKVKQESGTTNDPTAANLAKQENPAPDRPEDANGSEPPRDGTLNSNIPADPETSPKGVDGRTIKNSRTYRCDMTPESEHNHRTRAEATKCIRSRMKDERAATAEPLSRFETLMRGESDVQLAMANLTDCLADIEDAEEYHQSVDDFGEFLHELRERADTPDLTRERWRVASEILERADWPTAKKNDLPDDCFAYIEPGGEKVDGKTVPRSLRHFPYKDADGKLDESHIRDALGRIPQSKVSAEAKQEALGKIHEAAKKVGIDVAEKRADGMDAADPGAVSERVETAAPGALNDLDNAAGSSFGQLNLNKGNGGKSTDGALSDPGDPGKDTGGTLNAKMKRREEAKKKREQDAKDGKPENDEMRIAREAMEREEDDADMNETRNAQAVLFRTAQGDIDITDMLNRFATMTNDLSIERSKRESVEAEVRRLEAMPTRVPPVRFMGPVTREAMAQFAGQSALSEAAPQATQLTRLKEERAALIAELKNEPDERKRFDGTVRLGLLDNGITQLETFGNLT